MNRQSRVKQQQAGRTPDPTIERALNLKRRGSKSEGSYVIPHARKLRGRVLAPPLPKSSTVWLDLDGWTQQSSGNYAVGLGRHDSVPQMTF